MRLSGVTWSLSESWLDAARLIRLLCFFEKCRRSYLRFRCYLIANHPNPSLEAPKSVQVISEFAKLLDKFESALTSEDKENLSLSVQAAQTRAGQAKALVAEALLQHGLSHKIKRQGKDVIRSVLSQTAGGQVAEDMAFSPLVQAGRETIG